MVFLKKISTDFLRIGKILGWRFGLAWLFSILRRLGVIIRDRNLQAADQLMGEGPFKVHYSSSVVFDISGKKVFSGIREMYARDTYLHGGLLSIADGDFVLDLGANKGLFTSLSLAHGRDVNVLAVEPNSELNAEWHRNMSLNQSFSSRARLVQGFLGSAGEKQSELTKDSRYSSAEWLSEDELFSNFGVSRIDFLKCDIEGGEFGLLGPDSQILRMAKKIAIEVHRFAGDVDRFTHMLVSQGFTLKHIQKDPDGTVTVLGERSV